MSDLSEFRRMAAEFNRASGGLGKIGVDSDPIKKLTAVSQIVQGSIVGWGVIKAAADRSTMVSEAKFAAALVKYGPLAAGVAIGAVAAGMAVQAYMDRMMDG